MKKTFLGFILSFSVGLQPNLMASGVVNSADQASLQSAMNGGGSVTFGVDGTIVLSSTITVSQDTTVDAGGRTITIDGNNSVRLFLVNSGIKFTIKNVTLSRGRQTGADGVSGSAGNPASGAGIYNNGTLTLIGCALQTNNVTGGLGSTSGPSGGDGGSAFGAAIFNNGGTLNITNSSFSGNTAVGGGTASGPIATTGGAAGGAAISSTLGTVNVDGVSFVGNSSTGGPSSGSSGVGGDALGGALYMDTATLRLGHGSFSNNVTLGRNGFHAGGGRAFGGGLYSKGGSAALTAIIFSSNIATGGPATLPYRTGGEAAGGAIYSGNAISITNSTFVGNAANGGNYAPASGGALYGGTNLTVVNSLFTTNRANGGPWGNGGINWADGGAGYGGAISSGATGILWKCTFSQNQSIGGVTISTYRGGEADGGALFNLGTLWLTNCTLDANAVFAGDNVQNPSNGTPGPGGNANGGGIFNSNGVVVITHATISGNGATRGNGITPGSRSGGGVSSPGGTFRLRNSVLAYNTLGGDASGVLTDDGKNIGSDASGNFSAPGSLNNTDPLLAALADNGGQTPTRALSSGSPAIDAASATWLAATDQRGVTRPQGAAGDIGAFEATVPRPPQIFTFSPGSGHAGDSVTINGTNFTLATSVLFNGVNATFAINSDLQITATVPAAAVTGPITVVNPDGSANSASSYSTGPGAQTGAATTIHATTAVLNGTGTPDGSSTSGYFQFGLSPAYGSATGLQILGSGTSPVPLSATVSNLTPATTYHFRAVAQTASATNYGSDQIFNTPIPAISATSLSPSAVSTNTAVFNGQASNDNYGASFYFQYGATTNLGAVTALQSFPAGGGTSNFSANVSGLSGGRAYFVRAVIQNSYSTNYGSLQKFATLRPNTADYSLAFDGLDDSVVIAHTPSLNAYPMTLTAWFKNSQTDGFVGLVGKFTNGVLNGYLISIANGNLHAFYLTPTGTIFTSTNGLNSGFVSDGAWHHVAFAVDSSGGRLYVDGTLRDTVGWSGTPGPCTTTVPLQFGSYIDALSGGLDEIQLWNVLRSSTEIQSGMNIRLAGTEAGLLGYWPLDEGTGSTAADASGNGNNGALVNGPSWIFSGTPVPKRPALSKTRLPNGTFRVLLTGPAGQPFILQSATTVTNWTGVLTNSFGSSGTFQYDDTAATSTAYRFYRAILP